MDLAVQCYASLLLAIVVCLVCVSITHQYCIRTAKLRIMQTIPQDSTRTLVFCCQNLGKIRRGLPPMEAP